MPYKISQYVIHGMITNALLLCFYGDASAADWSNLPSTPNDNGHASVVEVFELPPTDIARVNPGVDLGSMEQAGRNGFPVTTNPGIGSALAAVPGKPGEFYMMTDRGPNYDNVNGVGKVYGKVFPLPNFTPAIIQVKLEQGKINLVRSIPLVDGKGLPVTGLTNNADDELAYTGTSGMPMKYQPSGLDTEALQILPDGKYLISEEYGPSIVVADADGKVLVRYVPIGKEYPNVNYAVKQILPAILKERRKNRGFENLAITPDGKTAYAILQSPLGNNKDKRYANSRLVRIFRLDISDPLEAKVTGMFAVMQNMKSEYPETGKQADLKYSDVAALAEDKLLLLERAEKKVKLVVADLSTATNFLGKPQADSLILEESSENLDRLTIHPANTREVFDSRDVFLQLTSDKLEGLAIITPSVVAISNDNDFGIGDNTNHYPSKVWLIRLGRSLNTPSTQQ